MRRPFLAFCGFWGVFLGTGCGLGLDLDPRPPPTELIDAAPADATGGAVDAGAGDGAAADRVAVEGGLRDAGSDAPGCDDPDSDGYGFGADCMGLDCDPMDPAVRDTGERPCGAPECGQGFQRCVGGMWATTCTGDAQPTLEVCNAVDDDCDGIVDNVTRPVPCGRGVCSGRATCTGTCAMPVGAIEVCGNAIDDNCNGMTDEGCGGCLWVSALAAIIPIDGTSPLTPYPTIQGAIDAAAARRMGPQRVCVMGSLCGLAPTVYNESVVMADGVSVEGGYLVATSLVPPPRSCNRNAVIHGVSHHAVTFSDIATPTSISGLIVERDGVSDPQSGILVQRATNVVVQDVLVRSPPGASAVNSFGVQVLEGSEVTITRSRIQAGAASAESVGIDVQQSRARIVDNCQRIDGTGRCAECTAAAGGPAIIGVTGSSRSMRSFGIRLDGAAGSTIDQTGVCETNAADGRAVDLSGASDGIGITRSHLAAWGTDIGAGVRMVDCLGAQPLVADNNMIAAAGTISTHGIDVTGDCNPVIARNVTIQTGFEGTPGTGVRCQGASACVIEGNNIISGPFGVHPTESIGIDCDGGCALVARNSVHTVQGGTQEGLVVRDAGPLVVGNRFLGGCATMSGDQLLGVKLVGSWSRFENNLIRLEDCSGGLVLGPSSSYWGLIVERTGLEEVDVHSNTIVASNTTPMCYSHVLTLAAAMSAPVGGGVFRNNILAGDGCGGIDLVQEIDARADPRIFEHQFFHHTNMVNALYDDEAGILLRSTAEVDALGTGGANLEGDALFCGYPIDFSLVPSSPCRNAGTPTGAPATDLWSVPRPAPPTSPSIGAFESSCG